MSNEKITYEIKLQPALLVILGVMAFGILANAFPTASPIQDALAESVSGSLSLGISHSGTITVY